jgi:competence protein ComEA
VDLDRAPADEIARLPRIGPALAARIVDHREAHGPFGSLEALDRVSGVGPGLLAAIKPYARFSGQGVSRAVLEVGQVGVAARVSLNTASEAELGQLPGIGPTRAAAIVADRSRNGRYARIEDLQRVRGIGPATIERLRSLVRVP